MSTSWPTSLVLAGAGKMGGAMLRGWLEAGLAAIREQVAYAREQRVASR